MRRSFPCILLLGSILGQGPRIQAQDGPSYIRFVQADEANDVEALLGLSQELRSASNEQARHLSMLAAAAAAYRANRFVACLQIIDSIDALVTDQDIRLRTVQLRFKGNALAEAGDVTNGIVMLDRGSALADSMLHPRERVDILVVKAERLNETGRTQEAMTCLREAQRLAERVGYRKGECMVMINLGVLKFGQRRWDEARDDFEHTLACALDARSERIARNATGNIAALAANSGRHADALRMLDSLLDELGDREPLYRAMLLSYTGYLRGQLGDMHQALASLRASISIYEDYEHSKGANQARQYLSATLWKAGRKAEAIATRNEVLRSAEAMGDGETAMLSHWMLSHWHEEHGDLASALHHARIMEELDDSLETVRYDNRVALFEVAFETERKDRRIAEQEQALALSAAEERRKRIQRNLSVAFALALLMVAMLLLRAMRSRQKLARQQQELHERHVDELLHQQEINAMNAMLEGQEKERDRLATELHDRLGSMLSTIKHQLGSVQDEVTAVRHDQANQYGKVSALLDEAVGEVRRISHDMVNVTLSRFGLAKALEDLCDSLRLQGRLDVELSLYGLEQRLPRALEIAVYRMVQELVGNVLKHARARELSIGVTRGPGRLSVIVSDDGAGFDPQHAEGGIGLANVRARAAAIGGTLHVDSAPGRGTTVSVECPVVE